MLSYRFWKTVFERPRVRKKMKTENWTERLLTQSSNVVPELARQIFETISEFSADQI